MPLIFPSNTLSAGGFSVDNSCRFNKADNAYLSKTLGTPTDADKFTISFWMKLGLVSSTVRTIFNIVVGGGANTFMQLTAADLMVFGIYDSSYLGNLTTTQVFRDPSAWYHFVCVYDSGNATAGNRMRLYVNGTEVTAFGTDTNPTQDLDSSNVSGATFFVGAYGDDDEEFDGYLAEFCFIDGLALTPSSFGEFDSDSPTIWKPKDPSGLTFGDNGFYLDFEASDNLGNDANGGTDLSETNLAATDQCTDIPTNNFPTINPLIKPAAAVPLTEGNLIGTFPGSWTALPATFGLTAGKWYFEAKCVTGNGGNFFIGVVTENQVWGDSSPYNETTGVFLYGPSGRKTVDGSSSEDFFGDVTSGDIIGVQLDLDSDPKTILFFLEGTATPDATPLDLPSTFDDLSIFPYFIGNSSSATANWEVNFGNPPYANTSDAADENGYGAFEYAPPSGYYALCTKNLAEFGG